MHVDLSLWTETAEQLCWYAVHIVKHVVCLAIVGVPDQLFGPANGRALVRTYGPSISVAQAQVTKSNVLATIGDILVDNSMSIFVMTVVSSNQSTRYSYLYRDGLT